MFCIVQKRARANVAPADAVSGKQQMISARISTEPSRAAEEKRMTRFQRILLLTAVCGVIAVGIAYLIIVLLG
jgi:hypothetical protein